ncbi:hypothetical protein FERRO_15730 [Ferrovum sp. JA12]|nr:hypothetical protein FERRO_15730 [Ferrovum sp. JA12]
MRGVLSAMYSLTTGAKDSEVTMHADYVLGRVERVIPRIWMS